ncbi:MAG: NifU family protein, partial [Acidimicrobiales bacterium]
MTELGSEDALAYGEVLGRIARLAEDLIGHPDPDVRGSVGELLDWIDAFHRDGLGRFVEMIRAWRGETFLEAAAADEIVGGLLTAYGLGDDRMVAAEAHDAVAAALEQVRPVVESHGGAIEVDDITDGVVRVRMSGTCDGCPSSAATLTYGVEVALREHWRDFRRLEVVDPATEVDPAKSELLCVTVPARAARGPSQP